MLRGALPAPVTVRLKASTIWAAMVAPVMARTGSEALGTSATCPVRSSEPRDDMLEAECQSIPASIVSLGEKINQ